MSLSQILLIIAFLALNAFFVGVQFAVIASRRSRLDVIAGPEHHGAALVRKWLEDGASHDRLIAASQLGITLVSLALGAVSEDAFGALLRPVLENPNLPVDLAFLGGIFPALPLLVSLTVVTSLHVVLGEQAPKVAVLRGPERFALLTAPVMHLFIRFFHGLIAFHDWATRMVLGLFGIPANGHIHSTVMSMEDLKEMVSGPEVEGAIDVPEREMLSAVINFGGLYVRQVSVPRTEIIAVDSTTTIGQAVQIAAQSGITKLPVYEESLDQILGILHMKDLLPALLQDSNLTSRPARELAREALFVPETASVNHLLVHMRARRQHLAITLDEFGGTAGLVTLEDLLEEIVGDVQDPFDVDHPDIQPQPDGSAYINGMVLIEDFNEHFGLNLYDPDYDTIAGFMLGRLGRIAQVGDQIEDAEHAIRLRVDSMDRLRIARIHLSRL